MKAKIVSRPSGFSCRVSDEKSERYELIEDYHLTYSMYGGLDDEMRIPAGFKWDGATYGIDSIALASSLVHDYAMHIGMQQREADYLFLAMNVACGVPYWYAYIRYTAVKTYQRLNGNYKRRDADS